MGYPVLWDQRVELGQYSPVNSDRLGKDFLGINDKTQMWVASYKERKETLIQGEEQHHVQKAYCGRGRVKHKRLSEEQYGWKRPDPNNFQGEIRISHVTLDNNKTWVTAALV